MYPEKMTLFTPDHELCSSGCTFRPLGVFPFIVLLMEGKWSRSAGSFTTELSWWFGCVCIWTSQKQFNSCISSPLWGWRKPPVAQQRGDTAFDGLKRRAQRKNHQKGERVTPEVFFVLLLNSVCSLLAFWKGQINNDKEAYYWKEISKLQIRLFQILKQDNWSIYQPPLGDSLILSFTFCLLSSLLGMEGSKVRPSFTLRATIGTNASHQTKQSVFLSLDSLNLSSPLGQRYGSFYIILMKPTFH